MVPHMAPPRIYDQVNRAMRGHLPQFLRARCEMSPYDIAFEIRSKYDIKVSGRVVRGWCRELDGQ